MAKRHIGYEQLIAYAVGSLAADDAAMVERHLAGHPEDALTVARFRMAQLRLSTDDSKAPPANVVARAKAIFQAYAPEPKASWLQAVDRFIARCLFDSRLQPMAVRSADGADHVSMTFATDETEIDVQVERQVEQMGQERWHLMGQISDLDQAAERSSQGVDVAATRPGDLTPVAEGSVNSQNTFTLDLGGAGGAFDLYIRTPQGAIVLPNIRIG